MCVDEIQAAHTTCVGSLAKLPKGQDLVDQLRQLIEEKHLALVVLDNLVPPSYGDLVGKMSAMAIMLLSDTNSLSFVKPVRRSFV